MKEYKRITLLCGHYGSGKTNIAVNMAFDMKERFDNVAIADLDIVNPYFRTKDSSEEFKKRNIRLICSEYANSNVDIPALPQDMYAITDDRSMRVVIDVGGDDRGALALGRLAPAIVEENDYEMLLVINCYRPLTKNAEDTLQVINETEYAGGIKVTGLINNSNLGNGTTPDDVLDSLCYAQDVSERSGIPLVMTTVNKEIFKELKGKIDNLFPLNLQKKIV